MQTPYRIRTPLTAAPYHAGSLNGTQSTEQRIVDDSCTVIKDNADTPIRHRAMCTQSLTGATRHPHRQVVRGREVERVHVETHGQPNKEQNRADVPRPRQKPLTHTPPARPASSATFDRYQ